MTRVPAIPIAKPLERPAFVALVGCVVGLVSFHLALPLYVAVLPAVVGAALYLRLRSGEEIGLVLMVAAAFWLYTDARTLVARDFPERCELSRAVVDIHYPVSAHSESVAQYGATVQMDGQPVRVLLRSDAAGIGYSMRAVADLELYRLRRDNSYHRYLLSEGYQAAGRIAHLYQLDKKPYTSLSEAMQELRAGLVADFERASAPYLTPEVRGMTYALSLGERSHLPKSVKESFTDTGVAHVIAVSGYHLGIIYLFLSSLLALGLWRWRHRRLRYALLFLGTLAYTLFTGASTATVRAFLMSSLILLAAALGRRTDKVQLLSLTVLIFLVVQPLSYLSVGLMLSVSAVWGILTFLPLFQKLITPSVRGLQLLRDAIFVSVSAQIGVLPFLFMFFGRANMSIVWSNIPLMYLSAVAIPYGLILVVMAGLFGAVPPFLLTIQDWLVGSMIRITRYFSLEAASLSAGGSMDVVQVILYYTIVVIFYRLAARQINAYSPYRHLLDEKVGMH